MPADHDYLRRPDEGSEGPSVLWMLVLINVGALALQVLFSPDISPPAGAISVVALQQGGWWTVFTHLFIHADGIHLIINMAVLILAGRRVLAEAGSRHFLYIYLVSGWVAAAASLLMHPDRALIGASGCVGGVIAAYAALHPDRSATAWLGAWAPQLRARNLFFGFLASSLILAAFALLPDRYQFPMVQDMGHAAHAAGLITGWLYARRLAPELESIYHREEFFPQGRRRRRRDTEAPVPARAGHHLRGNAGEPEFLPSSAPPTPLSNDEFLRQAVDPVLDKLYASGMSSLTPAERQILDEAANRFSRQEGNGR